MVAPWLIEALQKKWLKRWAKHIQIFRLKQI